MTENEISGQQRIKVTSILFQITMQVKTLTRELDSQVYESHTPELKRGQRLTDERMEAILNEIHGTPEDTHPVGESHDDVDKSIGDFEEDYQDQLNDGGFGDFDEGGFYETEGFLDEVQGHDIDDDSEDPDHSITDSDSDSDSASDSDSDSDSASDSDSDSDSTDVDEYNSLESGSGIDDSMFYFNSDESVSDFDRDSETDEEIPGIHTSLLLS